MILLAEFLGVVGHHPRPECLRQRVIRQQVLAFYQLIGRDHGEIQLLHEILARADPLEIRIDLGDIPLGVVRLHHRANLTVVGAVDRAHLDAGLLGEGTEPRLAHRIGPTTAPRRVNDLALGGERAPHRQWRDSSECSGAL